MITLNNQPIRQFNQAQVIENYLLVPIATGGRYQAEVLTPEGDTLCFTNEVFGTPGEAIAAQRPGLDQLLAELKTLV